MNQSQLLYVLVDMQTLKRSKRVQPLDRRPRRVPSRGALAAVLFGVVVLAAFGNITAFLLFLLAGIAVLAAVLRALVRRVRGAMIEVEGVSKSFGATRALAGVDMSVPAGTVQGLLGPNGAGKTTLVRILATLLAPDTGQARVSGVDVQKDPNTVRRLIGLAGQYAAVDETLTGRENLVMVGRLYRLGAKLAKVRAAESLERLGLVEAADRVVKTYSGGMRRRLDLSASLVGRPRVLILDEPTTGLDPRTRLDMWSFIRDLVTDGTTVLLTTQYLEEADQLADHIVVIDRGKVIASGTSAELKSRLGSELIEVEVLAGDLEPALAALTEVGCMEATVDTQRSRITIPVCDAV